MVRKFCCTFFLITLLLTITANAQGTTGGQRVEQIASEMPNITAWFYSDTAPNIEEVSLEIEDELLTATSLTQAGTLGLTHHYILVDCSTSTTSAQLEAVKSAVGDFADNLMAEDRVTVISFGVDVKVLVNGSNNASEIRSAVDEMQANEAGTVFFDALAEVSALAEVRELATERKLLYVFSDSVDYNLGGFTQTETQRLLLDAGLPLYAFGFDTGTKENLDNFGALARTTGGIISVVDETELAAAFADTVDLIRSDVWIATFTSRSNVLPKSGETVRLSTGQLVSEFTPYFKFNLPDNTVPEILSVSESDATITVKFSEHVTGANVRDNYVISYDDGSLAGISAAAYDEATLTATLTLNDDVKGGEVVLKCDNITDISQEKNPVDNTVSFSLTITPPDEAQNLDGSQLQGGQTGQEEQSDESGAPILAWIIMAVVVVLIATAVIASIKRRENARRAALAIPVPTGSDELTVALPRQEHREINQIDTGNAHFVSGPIKNVILEVSDISGGSKQVTLPINRTMFVGRSDICNVTFDDPRMSRQHFVIEESQNGFTITNLSEGGETFLNGVPIDRARPLNHGDKIEAGSHTIVFKTR